MTQLSLPLPPPSSEPHRPPARLWIVAGEPIDKDRLTNLIQRARFRHAFVDAGTGFPAFGADDYILFATAVASQFSLLVPIFDDARLSRPSPRTARDMVHEYLANPQPCPQGSQRVRDIAALSFTPGRRYELGSSVAAQRTTGVRTGLERLLFALRERPTHASSVHTASLCADAERSLDERVHPALRGLFRREHADALRQAWSETDGLDHDFLKAALAAYHLARKDFTEGMLWSQLSTTLRGERAMADLLVQPPLPGISPGDRRPPAPSLGYCVRRVFGLPFAMAQPMNPSNTLSAAPPLFAGAGFLTLPERRLWQMVGASAANRYRLSAHVEKAEDDGLALSSCLRNELHALLGLTRQDAVEDGNADVCELIPISPSIDFVPSAASVRLGEVRTFKGYPRSGGRHTIALHALTCTGQSATLTIQV